jgi:hypothetical protein
MTDALHHPARARLVEHLRTRAAALDAPGLRARVRAAAGELTAALDGVDEAAARRTVIPGAWTCAQVVDHVAQSTVRAAEELAHLLADRRPPGPPVYEGLLSGAAHRVPWAELREGLAEAIAALDAQLAEAQRQAPARSTATVRAVLVVPASPDDPPEAGAPFTVELDWKAYALVQRLHFLDHREQVRRLRAAGGRGDAAEEARGGQPPRGARA